MDDRWCILRTGGARTLPLATALTAAGFDAWTPTKMVKRRVCRTRKAKEAQPAAIMPTFVFVRARHLPDLLRILCLPSNPYPSFSLFRYLGDVVRVRDSEVERLRVVERRALPRAQRRTYQPGAAVRLAEGPYAGMPGVVQSSNGRRTMIAFGGWMTIEIETSTLPPDAVEQMQPTTGAAALAA
ncbi:hypothetical protein [Sphingomonas sp. T9W2]|uniref:transcription termination/antitermination protein NusG n=1 Tax=Sphingomonas sp. T9W2 TaxID=3143183 RepID=UPI0031F4ADDF